MMKLFFALGDEGRKYKDDEIKLHGDYQAKWVEPARRLPPMRLQPQQRQRAETLAAKYGKPLLVVDVGAADAAAQVRPWLDTLLAAHDGQAAFRLAVGGPIESEAEGVCGRARGVLGEVVRRLVQASE